MFETLVDVFLDALIDSLKILPFLFGVYLLIEYIEHRSADKLGKALRKMGSFGAIGGSILGAVPQCGFSVVASNLYSGRLITMGTLISVYLATSDEAIPMMIANPAFAGKLWQLILIKVAVAIIAGVLVDLILKLMGKAASVVLTQLYIEGVVSFGSLIAGLCTGAGVGLLVLFKTNKHNMKENFAIMGILYVFGVAAGFVASLF